MAAKAEVRNNISAFYDPSTHERLAPFAPIVYEDDFVGAGSVTIPAAGSAESGCDWVKKIVGTGTSAAAGIANAVNGKIRCFITAESEKAEASVYHGDQRNFVLGSGLVMEIAATVPILPTGTARVVFGLAGTWADDPMSMARSIWFRVGTNGTLIAESDDGVADTSQDTGVRIGTGGTSIFRIDTSNLGTILFYMDGTDITPSGTSFPYTGSAGNAQVQPFFGCYKSGGTHTAELHVDYTRLWQKRT